MSLFTRTIIIVRRVDMLYRYFRKVEWPANVKIQSYIVIVRFLFGIVKLKRAVKSFVTLFVSRIDIF